MRAPAPRSRIAGARDRRAACRGRAGEVGADPIGQSGRYRPSRREQVDHFRNHERQRGPPGAGGHAGARGDSVERILP